MSQQRSLGLSLEELARRTGETPEQLLRWRSLHLIGAEDQEGFGPEDVESVRLIQLSFRRGINAETMARAEAEEQGFFRHYVDQPFPAGIGPMYAVAEAAARLLDGKPLPDTIAIKPATLATASCVADDHPGLWKWIIFPPDFRAPALMALARRQAWTLKPAHLR